LDLPSVVENVSNAFARVPGVGKKSAKRYAIAMAQWDKSLLENFVETLSTLQTIKKCELCGCLTEEPVCEICLSDERKGQSLLCVVESYNDFLAIENSNSFHGVYHILGGVLNPLMGIGPENLKIDNLVDRIKKDGIKTVVLAINPSVEGDATCSYIKEEIGEGVTLERIGFGVPIGGSLDLLDASTINQALVNRRTLD
jgi:recombination protein RecR